MGPVDILFSPSLATSCPCVYYPDILEPQEGLSARTASLELDATAYQEGTDTPRSPASHLPITPASVVKSTGAEGTGPWVLASLTTNQWERVEDKHRSQREACPWRVSRSCKSGQE